MTNVQVQFLERRRLFAAVSVKAVTGLHVGLVVHGREVCTYREPRCGECVLKAEGLCEGLGKNLERSRT